MEKKRARVRSAPIRKARYEAWLRDRISEWNAARIAELDAKLAKAEARAIALKRREEARVRGIRAEPIAGELDVDIAARLDAFSIPEPNTGCKLWLGVVYDDGYGRVSVRGRLRRVHRVAYAAYHGRVPRNVLILHTCGQPTCIEESHLYIGTPLDNFEDMRRHGRYNPVRVNGRFAKADAG